MRKELEILGRRADDVEAMVLEAKREIEECEGRNSWPCTDELYKELERIDSLESEVLNLIFLIQGETSEDFEQMARMIERPQNFADDAYRRLISEEYRRNEKLRNEELEELNQLWLRAKDLDKMFFEVIRSAEKLEKRLYDEVQQENEWELA